MYSKIIFNSCTGSGKEYARLLSNALNIPAYSLEDAPKSDDNDIIYIGWLMAGKVMGYSKVKDKYNVRALVAVGMSTQPGSDTTELRKNNNVPDGTKVFPVQGGFHMSKLPFIFRMMMKVKNPDIVKKLEAKGELDDFSKAILKMAKTGDGEPLAWTIDEIVAACK